MDFAALDVRNDIQSPLVMKGLFQGRSAGGRAAALKNYGGQWGQYTEIAVIKALEWLKRKQNPDGSWGPNKTAMTGLGLLTFLAHGETTSSEKYGQTVEKAIRFLISQQDAEGRFCKTDDQPGPVCPRHRDLCHQRGLRADPHPVAEAGHGEGHPDHPERPAAQGRLELQLQQGRAARHIGGRLADPGAEVRLHRRRGESRASRRRWRRPLPDLKSVQDPETGPLLLHRSTGPQDRFGITGIGVLCLQLLGHAMDKEARQGLQALTGSTCDWDKPESVAAVRLVLHHAGQVPPGRPDLVGLELQVRARCT